jgi:FkbM family methyltransferase
MRRTVENRRPCFGEVDALKHTLKEKIRQLVPRPVWARARGIRLKREVRRYPSRVVSHRYGRSDLRVVVADELAAGWYDHDWPVPPELSLLEHRSLRPGARVFDLGAHQAVVALMLERAVQPGGAEVAVELNEHNARMAVENVRLNAPAAVTVVHAAVMDQPGRANADWDLNATVNQRSRGATVQAVTIDGLADAYGPPDLVYVDVEGFECHALRGAVETLASRPDWFIEVHAHGLLQAAGGSAEELLDLLRDYRLFVLREGDNAFGPPPPELPNERLFLAALA